MISEVNYTVHFSRFMADRMYFYFFFVLTNLTDANIAKSVLKSVLLPAGKYICWWNGTIKVNNLK